MYQPVLRALFRHLADWPACPCPVGRTVGATRRCPMRLCRAERDSLERSLFEAQRLAEELQAQREQLAGEVQSARLARQALQGACSSSLRPSHPSVSRRALQWSAVPMWLLPPPTPQEEHEHGPKWALPPLSGRGGPLCGLLPLPAQAPAQVTHPQSLGLAIAVTGWGFSTHAQCGCVPPAGASSSDEVVVAPCSHHSTGSSLGPQGALWWGPDRQSLMHLLLPSGHGAAAEHLGGPGDEAAVGLGAAPAAGGTAGEGCTAGPGEPGTGPPQGPGTAPGGEGLLSQGHLLLGPSQEPTVSRRPADPWGEGS